MVKAHIMKIQELEARGCIQIHNSYLDRYTFHATIGKPNTEGYTEELTCKDCSLLVAVWTDIVDGAFVHYSVIYNNKAAIFTSEFFCVDEYPVSSDEAVKAAIQFLNK